MSIDASLSPRAAEEIRAMLARRSISKSELARRLEVSHTWVTNRLAGHQEIGLNELGRIASALDVSVGELLPAEVRGHTHYDAAPVDPLAPRVIATIGETRPTTTPRRPVRQTRPLGASKRPSGAPLGARRRPLSPATA